MLDQINEQDNQSSATGWRIVEKERDVVAPNFDDEPTLRSATERPKEDQWRTVEITRPEKKDTGINRTLNEPSSTISRNEDKGFGKTLSS